MEKLSIFDESTFINSLFTSLKFVFSKSNFEFKVLIKATTSSIKIEESSNTSKFSIDLKFS